MSKDPPEELFASFQENVQTPFGGTAECLLVTSATDVNGWAKHARIGSEARVGRYKLVEVKTLTVEPKFT